MSNSKHRHQCNDKEDYEPMLDAAKQFDWQQTTHDYHTSHAVEP